MKVKLDEILDFLYYQIPIEYQLMFGEARDPNANDTIKRVAFKKHLLKCSLSEYCQLIIKAFLIKYPLGSLRGCLLDVDDKGIFLVADRPLRSKDIQRIDFNYKKAKLRPGSCPHEPESCKTKNSHKLLNSFSINFCIASDFFTCLF